MLLTRHALRLGFGITLLLGAASGQAQQKPKDTLGDGWKQHCAAAPGSIYGCCQKKYNECTRYVSPGTPAMQKCKDAYQTCKSTRTLPIPAVTPEQHPDTVEPIRPGKQPPAVIDPAVGPAASSGG